MNSASTAWDGLAASLASRAYRRTSLPMSAASARLGVRQSQLCVAERPQEIRQVVEPLGERIDVADYARMPTVDDHADVLLGELNAGLIARVVRRAEGKRSVAESRLPIPVTSVAALDVLDQDAVLGEDS
jgi:hypothetical protein